MPAHPMRGVGPRIAAARRARHMTQEDLALAARVSYGTVKAIEREARMPSDDVLDALAAALGRDPAHLATGGTRAIARITDAMPRLSAAIAAYDLPADGPVRPLSELHAAVAEAVNWRLGAQYVRLAQAMPPLLEELARALEISRDCERTEVAGLLAAAYRAADAVAYKHGASDLSARLVDLMRWATDQAENPLLTAAAAYVRTETFFAARAHGPGLRALEIALDRAPQVTDTATAAARGALHMRAAVVAGRVGDSGAAGVHIAEARRLAERVPEGVYEGTACGPDSVRIHEVSVAVALGQEHVQRALDVAHEWAPPRSLPSERRSGFYIELARAQLWAGRRGDAFESLRVARRAAPQHTREHPWAREDIETLRRLDRGNGDALTHFAEWIGAT
ncbi:helix-turn-helix domain-containing protein [Actinacidiphila sp. ITFR-21]|uniref:helix-turn-helix domain-containing protein n=1 Tax=Actinacidiphila sp. ITFR-21 TaxID=3075199 RepID=UPI00288C2AEF|nr:helix-turn-helix transcriptional regulator [Streptomyces sp. ITFR-21]WNI19689.1 helix-turn-helix transcriptional regulator [Streptomyces sp. ITFR-21]